MKKLIKPIFLFLLLTINNYMVKCADNPVNADIVVASDGSGDFTTLQAAINAVESNSDRRTIIYIKRGLYNQEKLLVSTDKKNVSLIGESRDETIISYHIYDCSSASSGNKCPAEDAVKWTGENISTSATLTIYGDGFRAENLTIQNTAGPVGQALAITVQSDKNIFINCNILGYQDTIYLWASGKRTYFENCLVVGRTDYIYGAGIAFFQECEIRSWGGGWITAPATPQYQDYGYVFNECQLTYATGSPRAGDDGSTVALGRPWHGYPKVTWMNTYFCDKIDPLGWPTTWNMTYADTSIYLELFEYNNTGPGADMSERANWVGIRALTDMEALDYTVQKVLNGTDGWDPTAEAPLIKTYIWTDSAATNGWLLPDNWSNKTLPLSGEIAIVDSGYIINADGGNFEADLNLKKGSGINIFDSSNVSYLSMENSTISCFDTTSLTGKISTKDTNQIDVLGILNMYAKIVGVHNFSLINVGKVILANNNSSFAGDWKIKSGILHAQVDNCLGTGNIEVSSGATLIISSDNAFYPTSRLNVKTGASLILNANITLSEFYINSSMQVLGTYNSSTNPELISGSGSITVGRPKIFQFTGASSGNWDNPLNFIPQLLPEAGEKVICEREMETTTTVFTANILLSGKGSIRLRGSHKCTGQITMEEGAKLSYATSGSGFTLDAPIQTEGDIILIMSSANTAGNAMRLPGPISGSNRITAKNIRDIASTATVILSGNNSAFNGIWDLTSANVNAAAVTAIEGAGENSFGFGSIEISEGNKVILNHKKCAGDTLILNFSGDGKVVISQDVWVKKFVLNSTTQDTGVYSAITNPDIFESDAKLFVGRSEPKDTIPATDTTTTDTITEIHSVIYRYGSLEINGTNSIVKIYNLKGVQVAAIKQEKSISLLNLEPGIYIVQYIIDGNFGVLNILL